MKKIIFSLFILICIGLLFAFYAFKAGNIQNNYVLKIREENSLDQVLDSLEQHHVISNNWTFDLVKRLYPIHTIPRGLYKIESGLSNLDLLRKLKYGHQDPIRFTISTGTFVEEIAKRAGDKMGFDSMEMMRVLYSDSIQSKYKINPNTALTLFTPSTLDFYWTSTASQFIDKWARNQIIFWNTERLTKAKAMNLTPQEVYSLASLVQKEYSKSDERSKIAGVLLNRMVISMPLQVDATCKYATRDFAAKRVMNYHILFNSPYNTYQNRGLPPGPICIPELSTIDACLNPESHGFIYYCADPSLNGYHIFSKTLTEHENVAKTYRQKMDAMGVK